MTATATRTANPLRAKALAYLRDERVLVDWATSAARGQEASVAHALISPAPGDPSGRSVYVTVTLRDGTWECDEHPGENACSHRLAVQMVTGWGHLGGRWRP